MSELPIKLKFFKKIELYQELNGQNKKAGYSTRLTDWQKEKKILKWTAVNHHHLGSEFSIERLYMIFEEEVNKVKEEFSEVFRGWEDKNIQETIINHLKEEKRVGSLKSAIENLKIRGYAREGDKLDFLIIFTLEGLLMGEVIYEVEDTWLGKIKYPFFLYITWTTIILAILITMITFVNLVVPYIYFLFFEL